VANDLLEDVNFSESSSDSSLRKLTLSRELHVPFYKAECGQVQHGKNVTRKGNITYNRNMSFSMFPLSCARARPRSGCHTPAHESQALAHFYWFSI
jgi:hypothetical protein